MAMTKTRLEAFSDGVIAILITIMVLELKVPEGTSWADLQPTFRSLLIYLLSFINLGIYWGNHHHLIHLVKKLNSRIMLSNLNFLFWLSLIPFTTAWMGETNFETISVATYGFLLLCCGISYYFLQRMIMNEYSSSSKEIEALNKTDFKGMISTVCYLASVPLAFVHILISGALFVFVAVWWLIPDKNIEEALEN